MDYTSMVKILSTKVNQHLSSKKVKAMLKNVDQDQL